MRSAWCRRALALAALLLLGTAAVSTEEPAKAPAAPEAGRLAGGVHVIGVCESGGGDFQLVHSWGQHTNWSKLCAALVEQGKKDGANPGKRFWALLPKAAQAIVADPDAVKRVEGAVPDFSKGRPQLGEDIRLLNQFSRALEGVLRREDLYDEKSFVNLPLDDEIKDLIKRRNDLTPLEVQVLNRALVEASFPGVFKPTDFSLADATIPVRVLATKEPITLVLCSSGHVRWQIQADKGAKIERVIVGGYHLSDIKGTTAPVTYRVHEMRGARVDPQFFYAYKKDAEDYPKMVTAVQKLTGKPITTFQGRYRYEPGKPFVVGAKESIAVAGAPGETAKAHRGEAAKAPSAADVVRWIEQLGADAFAAREKAAEELRKAGEAARKQLEATEKDTTDAEVRKRVKVLLRDLNEARRLAIGVHVVGVYEAGAAHFELFHQAGQHTKWGKLCAALVDQGKKPDANPGKRFWSLLPKAARLIVTDKDAVKRIEGAVADIAAGRKTVEEDHQLMNRLTRALEVVLRREDLYDEPSFSKLPLNEEIQDLAKRHKDLTALEVQVLNRAVLEASFPGLFQKIDYSIADATIPVRVLATKEPLTLVLCSYSHVRWQIQPDKGAKIEKVIVSGYHLSDIKGTTAPVTYRVHEMRDNEEEPRYFYAYQQDSEEYPKLVKAVQTLTGKPIATFQGRYRYERGKPIVVGK